MYVNPFEKMKKIREEKERLEKEAIEERKRFAKLGAQLGFRENSKYSMTDYELAEANKSPIDERFTISPQKAQELYQNPNNYSSQNIYEEYQEENNYDNSPVQEYDENVYLEEENYDDHQEFFEVESNALEKIDALLNIGKEIPKNLGEIKDIQEKILDSNSEQQFFSLFGEIKTTEEQVKEIFENSPINVTNIDMKKIFSYNSPYLYILKKIINAIRGVTVQDKNAIWERVVLFLSSTSYGRNEATQEEAELIESNIDMFDPIEAAKNEFKNLIEAYKIQEKLIIFNLKDFRGLDFQEVKGATLFVYELFEGIKNMKFIFELPEELYNSESLVDSSKSWLTFFDIIYLQFSKPNLYNDNEVLEEFEIDYDDVNYQNHNSNINSNQHFKKINKSDNEIDLREINFIDNLQNGTHKSSIEDKNMMQKNIESNDYADYRPDKNTVGEPIRIKITDSLEKAKQEELERDIFLQQQKNHQFNDVAIDEKILIQDSGSNHVPGRKVDLSANFNAEGYRHGGQGNQNYANSFQQTNKVSGLGSRDPNISSQGRLEQMRRGLENSSNIIIKNRHPNNNVQKKETFNIGNSNIEIPNNWGKLK